MSARVAPPSAAIEWSDIDTVLLDLDGTLLDLHFDNVFWLRHLPRRYAEHHTLALTEAEAWLGQRFKALAGTMQWYCLDYWQRELGVDILALKHEVAHLIAPRPGAEAFLQALRAAGKQVVLATNAHPRSLALKMQHVPLHRYFERMLSSHEFARPKEDAGFWHRARAELAFEPRRTLLIDDNEAVLGTAHGFGVGRVLGIRQPDSRRAPVAEGRFPRLAEFAQLLPVTPSR